MEIDLEEQNGVRLAIEGCCHGTLHSIYASVTEACERKGWPGVDLLIIGGDFQAVRNRHDLKCVNMPEKHRQMGDFHEYYSGAAKAPYPTIFVGGNHEASNYLFELYYGGWVAPNIYYMGAANVVRLGPLRIVGMSGIWKGYDYRKSHHERLPYNQDDLRSVYHVRELDVRKLLQIRTPTQIGISHDWPRGVEWKGNHRQLFKFKPHLEADAKDGSLGNVAAKQVLDFLRPDYWFSAHLHCKYTAIIKHEQAATGPVEVQNTAEIELDESMDEASDPAEQPRVPNTHNADEIDLDDDAEAVAPSSNPQLSTDGATSADRKNDRPEGPYTQSLEAATAALPASFHRKAIEKPVIPPSITNGATSFLALSKCLAGQNFLQLHSIPCAEPLERPLKLFYDAEWLAITRSSALSEPLVVGAPDHEPSRASSQADYYKSIDEQKAWIKMNLSADDLVIPENFELIAPVHGSESDYAEAVEYPNLQTETFCNLLQIPNPFEISEESRMARMRAGPAVSSRNGSSRDHGPRRGHDDSQFRGRGRGRGRYRGGRGGVWK